MDYKNTETKLDTLVSYFNEERINLTPVFQRGKVWPLKMRRELIKNIVQRRPIPAIFLYKDEAGSKYSFNILDGKQRLESILMFIGSARADFAIRSWSKYIFGSLHKADVGFSVDLGDGNKAVTVAELSEKTVRDLREYPIPTIEIALNDNTTLDEMISLFVDINQYGVKVNRLDIVKAMKMNDKLLGDVYDLIAEKQKRQQDIFARQKATPFVKVLKHLQVVASIADNNAQVDRMWEKLFELALFVRSHGKHRKPAEILKSFIKSPEIQQAKLTASERATMSKTFTFLREAYKHSELPSTRLATDQTHFYIMATSLLQSDLLETIEEPVLTGTLEKFGKLLDETTSARDRKLTKAIKDYKELSAKQTTDVSRREARQKMFIETIKLLAEEPGPGA